MKAFKFKSLTMRIWATFTAIILIIICSISFLYILTFRILNENAMIQDLKVAHNIILQSNSFSNPIRFNELKNLKGSNHFIIKIGDNNIKHIVDINKMEIKPPTPGRFSPPPPNNFENGVKRWLSGYITDEKANGQQFKEWYKKTKYIFIISSIENNSTEKSYLVSYMPDNQDNSLLYTVLLIGMLFIGIGFFAAKLVANYISKPLKELEDCTVRISHKDWKKPIEVKSSDEIGRLANSMNIMQRELKRADEEEKMFLQSISHDLKTPVMVIMGHAQGIIDGVYIDSIEKTTEIIKDEAVRLEKKIKQMLYLNTLDYVLENNNETVNVDLNILLLNIINRFEVINSKLQWNADMDHVSINASLDKIQVVVENILDNAIRYAKNRIKITLKTEKSYALLEIFNDGPKINDQCLDKIFENLYKDKTGNFGLGLAISKKILNFYNGTINAVNKYNGVSFIIKFPLM